MRTAFVGLVSRFGLESWMPESRATRHWLLDATAHYPVACIWAVLPEEPAAEVAALFAAGDAQIALHRVTQTAEGFGTLCQ